VADSLKERNVGGVMLLFDVGKLHPYRDVRLRHGNDEYLLGQIVGV
jgi:hypothetical protein